MRALDPPPDVCAGFEARGFLLVGVADALGLPFVPLRKAGKLPGVVAREEYALEYGSAVLEVAAEPLRGYRRALLLDDVLATGGTAAAGARLLARCGVQTAALLVVAELAALRGAERLAPLPVWSAFVEE